MSQKAFLDKKTKNLQGKAVALSGSTGGIGRELCKLLAKNNAEIILIDRNKEKQNLLIAEIKNLFPSVKIEGVIADMESIDDVRGTVEYLLKKPLFALILNAGAYSIPRHKTSIGYDNVFTINFISPYYMARRLLPHIKANNGRIIAVGSIAHNYSKTDEQDIDFSTRKRSSEVYGNAKRYLMYSFFDLKQRGEPTVVAHPGITFTGITAHYPKLIFAIIKHPMKIIFMKPKKAALSIYYGLFHTPKDSSWIGPSFFDIWGLPKERVIKTADTEERARIASVADKIYESLEKQAANDGG